MQRYSPVMYMSKPRETAQNAWARSVLGTKVNVPHFRDSGS